MGQCRPVSPVISEIQGALNAEGTGRVVSLSNLRRIVAMSGNNVEMCSGSQQDSVEFIDLLWQNLPTEIYNMCMFSENIVRKFVVNDQLVACPNCESFPNANTDLHTVLQLHIPDTKDTIQLSELLNQYFSPVINDSGRRCSMCCPHSSCPGTDMRCKLKPFSEERQIMQFPNYLFIPVSYTHLTLPTICSV